MFYYSKLCCGYFIKKQKTAIFSNSSRFFLIYCYISFSRCFSFIGRIRGSQQLSLANNCLVERVIIHEFVHALGFFHEQSRPDRDTTLTYFWIECKEVNYLACRCSYYISKLHLLLPDKILEEVLLILTQWISGLR